MYSAFARIQNLLTWLERRGEGGATAVEYGLLVVFLCVVTAFAIRTLGHTVKQAFTTVVGAF